MSKTTIVNNVPELPEVETTLRGIRPFLEGKKISIVVRERNLRWPIAEKLESRVNGLPVLKLRRRAKYILIHLPRGGLIIHLGMSGSMRVLPDNEPPGKHDHFDLINEDGRLVRFTDPRKFGCLLHSKNELLTHPRLVNLGVEPLQGEFNAAYLYALSRNRRASIKSFIMDGRVVAGVGNIYASEALFLAGIHPLRKSGSVSKPRYEKMVDAVRRVLAQAIAAGGTTLQDFTRADGSPGYFEQSLSVYGREGGSCIQCGRIIRKAVIGQRSTFYCPGCQK